MTIVRVPWTAEQVYALDTFQTADYIHPFTCVEDHPGCDRRLIPTQDGWICPHCDYTQDWCHDWMLETWAGPPSVTKDEVDSAAAAFCQTYQELMIPLLGKPTMPSEEAQKLETFEVWRACIRSALAMHKRLLKRQI